MKKDRRLQRNISKLRALVEALEEWQDSDRTFLPVELSKLLPGWFDN